MQKKITSDCLYLMNLIISTAYRMISTFS